MYFNACLMKKTRSILSLLSFFIGMFVFAQFSPKKKLQIDSLNQIIHNAKHDTLVADAYSELSGLLWRSNIDTLRVLGEKIVNICEDNLKKELTLKEQIRFKKLNADALNNIGYVYRKQGDNALALKYYLKSLKLREEIADQIGIANSYNNIGNIFLALKNNNSALEYFQKGLVIRTKIGDNKRIATTLNNIGGVYARQNEYYKALEYYQKSLKLRESLDDVRGVANSLNNIGGIYEQLKKNDLALENYFKSLELRRDLGDRYSISISLQSIANIYNKENEFIKAKDFATEALILSQNNGIVSSIRDASLTLTKIYQKEGDINEAFNMYKLYIKMRDSILNLTTEKSIIRQQARYDIDKKEQEIKLLSTKNELQDIKLNRNRILAFSSLVALGLAIILIMVTYRGYRKKQIINKLLEEQKQEITRKNEEKKAMLKEIHHRVKNNLQVVNSLLRMQKSMIEDESVVAMFEEAQKRVISMALLHEKMYKTEDLQYINVQEHITLLIQNLVKSYAIEKEITLNVNVEKTDIGLRTLVPLCLIINEMVANILKHAFKSIKKGLITINLKETEKDSYELIIGDNGVGIKHEKESTGIGAKLIQIFTKQLHGKIEQLEKKGTVFKIVFKKID